jgi:hypothetical protein
MHISATRLVLQTAFGAKQDRQDHTNPVWTFKSCPDKRLCPVAHCREYLNRTKRLRGEEDQLLITTIPPFRAASKATIVRWTVETLNQAGVYAPAGSTRAAAASFAQASRVPLSAVLEAADWSRVSTLRKHYQRLLPPEVLQRLANSPPSVQAAVLHHRDEDI